MKTISRTIGFITVEAEVVNYVDGVWEHKELTPVITTEKITKGKVEKLFSNQLEEGDNLVIKAETYKEENYAVPVEEFIKLAEKLKSEENEEIQE